MAKVDEIYQSLVRHMEVCIPQGKNGPGHIWASTLHRQILQKLESISGADTNTNLTYAAALSGSPGKKLKIYSECIDQLQKWHEPLNCEEITKKQ